MKRYYFRKLSEKYIPTATTTMFKKAMFLKIIHNYAFRSWDMPKFSQFYDTEEVTIIFEKENGNE